MKHISCLEIHGENIFRWDRMLGLHTRWIWRLLKIPKKMLARTQVKEYKNGCKVQTKREMHWCYVTYIHVLESPKPICSWSLTSFKPLQWKALSRSNEWDAKSLPKMFRSTATSPIIIFTFKQVSLSRKCVCRSVCALATQVEPRGAWTREDVMLCKKTFKNPFVGCLYDSASLKFLSMKSRYSLSHVLHENVIFLVS